MKDRAFKLISLFWVLLTLSLLLAPEAFALNVNRRVLPNGLVVLHSESHSLPVVMVTLIVKAGQSEEPGDKAGLANLTAELLAEGTKTRTSGDISDEIEFIGASLDTSAGSDYTTLTLAVLKKDLHKGLELFSDVLLNPVFPQKEIRRKKEQIKGILKQREEEPSFVAGRAFIKEVFGEDPYGKLAEGSADTLDRISKDDIVQFYKANFLPNNSILSIAGDLTSEEVDTFVAKYLSKWGRSDLPARLVHHVERIRSRKIIVVDKDLTQANIILGGPGLRRGHPDYYAVSVMNYILGGGGFSSRLMQSVRDKMGLAYDIRSFFAAHKRAGSFQVNVQTKNESTNDTIKEILRQMNRLKAEEVSDDELSEAKAYLTGSFPRRLDTNRKIADFLAAVEYYNLGMDYATKYPGYINSVTKKDVLRVARKYLDTKNFVLVVVADRKKAKLKLSEDRALEVPAPRFTLLSL